MFRRPIAPIIRIPILFLLFPETSCFKQIFFVIVPYTTSLTSLTISIQHITFVPDTVAATSWIRKGSNLAITNLSSMFS